MNKMEEKKSIGVLDPNLLSQYLKKTPFHIAFNQLVVEREIGEGSYGKIFLGRWNNETVALKFCRHKETIDNFIK